MNKNDILTSPAGVNMFSSAQMCTVSEAPRTSGDRIRFPQACVVIRIFNWQKARYHCAFLYDDADVTIGRHSGSQSKSLPTRPPPVAQALLPVRSCQAKDSAYRGCRIATKQISPPVSNRKSGIRIQPKPHENQRSKIF
jgi:hypothetical protein